MPRQSYTKSVEKSKAVKFRTLGENLPSFQLVFTKYEGFHPNFFTKGVLSKRALYLLIYDNHYFQHC